MGKLFRQFAGIFGARDREAPAPTPAWMDSLVHRRRWGEPYPYIAIRNFHFKKVDQSMLVKFEEAIHDSARKIGLAPDQYDVWINEPLHKKSIFIGAKSKEISDALVKKVSETFPILRPDRILTPEMAEERKAARSRRHYQAAPPSGSPAMA